MKSGSPTSARETAVSVGILVVLAAVGFGVGLKQCDFNPALIAAKAPPAAGDSPGEPIQASSGKSDHPVINLAGFAPEGLSAMSTPETFGPDTLSDKIDGKAELYLAAGVIAMTCQRLRLSQQDWMEAFAYDMGEHRNAFAVYSAQQRPGARKLDITAFSYRSGGSLYMVAGRWYVEMAPASTSPALTAAMEALARRMAAALGGAGEPAMDELSLFPAEHLVDDSKVLATEVDFGVTGFSNVFVARYDIDGQRVSAFLSRRRDARQAAEMARQYVEFFRPFGATTVDPPEGVQGAAAVELLGIYKVAFARGRYVAGVHEAPSPAAAAAVAKLLDDRLSAAAGQEE